MDSTTLAMDVVAPRSDGNGGSATASLKWLDCVCARVLRACCVPVLNVRRCVHRPAACVASLRASARCACVASLRASLRVRVVACCVESGCSSTQTEKRCVEQSQLLRNDFVRIVCAYNILSQNIAALSDRFSVPHPHGGVAGC